jgi:hypothetical protein
VRGGDGGVTEEDERERTSGKGRAEKDDRKRMSRKRMSGKRMT